MKVDLTPEEDWPLIEGAIKKMKPGEWKKLKTKRGPLMLNQPHETPPAAENKTRAKVIYPKGVRAVGAANVR